MKRISIHIIMLFGIGIISCSSPEHEVDELDQHLWSLDIQSHDKVAEPKDNIHSEKRALLGELLFFDKALSRDSSISCASCHKPAFAFADNLALSPGVENRAGKRNAPTLTNVAYQPYLTREGGVPSLEQHVLVPFQESNEFDLNILEAQARLKKNPVYEDLSQDAYARSIDYFVIVRALANYQRTLISNDSPFDQFYFFKDDHAMEEEAKRGMDLFFSDRLQCNACHSGPDFTNATFQNNGLYTVYKDEGRARLTGEELDLAKFKVPGLRNLKYTAPFMHDGSLASIEDVIEHYSSGGKAHIHKSPKIKPLNLTAKEKQELKAFLISLSDESFWEKYN